MNITNKEKKYLWELVNNSQNIMLINITKQLPALEKLEPRQRDEWLKESSEEYDFLSTLKAKLIRKVKE